MLSPRTTILLLAVAALPLQRADHLDDPFGPTHPLVSPDGAHELWGDMQDSTLWLEDTRTHARQKVTGITVQTMSLAWAPDSSAFAVNDRPTSTDEEAYLYDTVTLQRLDLARRVAAADPTSHRFFVPGLVQGLPTKWSNGQTVNHSHLFVVRWLDAQHVEVQLAGDTGSSGTPEHIIVAHCFGLRYRISRSGEVQKLSERVIPPGSYRNCPDHDV